MAAGRLPEPGTEFGPCEHDCEHKDCAETVAMAASICWRCERPIGFKRRFYRMQDGSEAGASGESYLVHAGCEEDAIEAEHRAEDPALADECYGPAK
jgi:hypothetical protein